VANRSFTLSGNPIILQNIFSLGLNDSFVKIVTSVINKGDLDIKNVLIWTGTRDDYVGTTDVNTKTRGNLNTGSFVAVTANNQSSRAIMITNPTEGVLFYSETPGVMTAYALCCSFSNVYNTNPLSLAPMTPSPTDGSYAAVLPVGNVSVGSSGSITWYYAAGVINSLASVAQSVAAAQAIDSGVGITSSITPSSSATITPSSSLTITPTVSSTGTFPVKIVIVEGPSINITKTQFLEITNTSLLYIVGFVPAISVLICLCCIGACIYRRKSAKKEITKVTEIKDDAVTIRDPESVLPEKTPSSKDLYDKMMKIKI